MVGAGDNVASDFKDDSESGLVGASDAPQTGLAGRRRARCLVRQVRCRCAYFTRLIGGMLHDVEAAAVHRPTVSVMCRIVVALLA